MPLLAVSLRVLFKLTVPVPTVRQLQWLLMLLVSFASIAQTPPTAKQSELEAIRTQINDVKNKIDAAKKDVDSYLTELQQNEMAAVESATTLQTLAQSIKEKQAGLEQLRSENTQQVAILSTERNLLADQLRIAYKTGRHDLLKLFLNQEDPARIGRMMTFHDYYNRARARKIDEVKMTLQNLQLLQTRIDTETIQLQSMRDQHINNIQQLGTYRDSRNSIISQLQEYISSQGKELQNLQRDEQELSSLLNGLGTGQSVVEEYEDIPPFGKMKGKLKWPVAGKVITRFGSAKKGDKLRWNGVLISAGRGSDVTAISPGKVIFADWFRNLGLLIIIDHGDGYMSLYGHNESLVKKAGDFVKQGELIANVGDTGGQSESALYFEIRKQGTPLDPDLWCKG